MRVNLPIDTDPQQQEAASPQVVVARSSSLSLSTIQLRRLLEVFASGTDRSVNLANEIEGLIALEFSEDHPVQELAEELAQYRPGGGEFLISESEMLPIVAKWLARIQDGKL